MIHFSVCIIMMRIVRVLTTISHIDFKQLLHFMIRLYGLINCYISWYDDMYLSIVTIDYDAISYVLIDCYTVCPGTRINVCFFVVDIITLLSLLISLFPIFNCIFVLHLFTSFHITDRFICVRTAIHLIFIFLLLLILFTTFQILFRPLSLMLSLCNSKFYLYNNFFVSFKNT